MGKTEWTEKTIQVGNAVITIHRPILSEQERCKREEDVKTALMHYGRAVYDAKAN